MFNAYLFGIIAMVFWGIAPIFGKLGLSTIHPLVALAIRSVIVSVLLLISVTVAGQWGAMTAVSFKDVTYIAFEGICAALLGQLAYYYALKYGEVGQISPIVAAFPLVAMFLGILFLGEKVTLYKVLASILILLGIVLMKY